jgi:hypothetical protein
MFSGIRTGTLPWYPLSSLYTSLLAYPSLLTPALIHSSGRDSYIGLAVLPPNHYTL